MSLDRYPLLRPTPKAGVFETAERLAFSFRGITYSILPGFETDLASIPWYLRWLFKFGGPRTYPAIVHDYLYKTGLLRKSEADLLFLKLMLLNGVGKREAKIIWKAVDLFGIFAWLGHRRKDK